MPLADQTIQGFDLALFSAGGSTSGEWAPRFVEAGAGADAVHLCDHGLQGVVEGHVPRTEAPVAQQPGSLAGAPGPLSVSCRLQAVRAHRVVVVVPGAEARSVAPQDDHPDVVVLLGSVTFIVATMGINIVANFVSPAYDIANLYPEKISFKTGGLITSILSALVCPWMFVSSPQSITVLVGVFGSVLGPMYGIMIADYHLVKRERVVVEDLYTLSPAGSLYFDGGWNHRALWALALSGLLSIGLSLSGAFGLMFNVGDWGWAIGALAGAVLYRLFSAPLVAATAV